MERRMKWWCDMVVRHIMYAVEKKLDNYTDLELIPILTRCCRGEEEEDTSYRFKPDNFMKFHIKHKKLSLKTFSLKETKEIILVFSLCKTISYIVSKVAKTEILNVIIYRNSKLDKLEYIFTPNVIFSNDTWCGDVFFTRENSKLLKYIELKARDIKPNICECCNQRIDRTYEEIIILLKSLERYFGVTGHRYHDIGYDYELAEKYGF